MNLTTKGRYAVMAMVDIAVNDKGTPISLAQISERQGIALNYLEQIFMRLRKNGLVSSVRGPGGGYIVAKPLEEIRIAEIVKAVDESIKMTRCQSKDHNGCMSGKAKCATHSLWDGLGKQIFNYLNSISLADMCENNNSALFYKEKENISVRS